MLPTAESGVHLLVTTFSSIDVVYIVAGLPAMQKLMLMRDGRCIRVSSARN